MGGLCFEYACWTTIPLSCTILRILHFIYGRKVIAKYRGKFLNGKNIHSIKYIHFHLQKNGYIGDRGFEYGTIFF